ncbi:heterokaryon incompatibility protein-domain-containing protein [Xylaria sp. FL1777]|nr:heterokaryon incompatibility protein-domain-containing protein [Xylaria sp. FL1777]
MWLIHIDTLTLHQVSDADSARYAILSHTWEEEEVTFQDLQDLDKARKKKGFGKILETCRIATSRGLQYAWVDTCCIDKSSSAELSEAINSMFKWYQQSDVCVAFLSDLSPSETPDVDFPRRFPRCRWLTRGFTLQELIAPTIVSFYDSSWNYRGTKSGWRSLISIVTGIDPAILEDPEGLSSVPVGRRMSWAAKRNTTREEDRAYCLLGTFDVNMPMIYGEGPKAFLRLQEEIARQTSDLSLFAWKQKGPDPPYRGILAKSPAEFANCGTLKHKIRDADLTSEYSFTNKGLRIETALVTFPSVTRDFVWNLGCSERDDWSKLEIQGYLGIFLAKTAIGYVRAEPNLLFEAGNQRRGPNELGTFYMKASLNKLESARIDKRFEGAIYVRCPETIRISGAAPGALWDQNRLLFLNQGQGINAYVRILLQENLGLSAAVTVIVACSTMERPICTIWDHHNPMYGRVQAFIKSKVLADYVGADYLRLRLMAHQHAMAATSKAVANIDSSSRNPVSLQVELQEHVFEGQRGFVLNIEVSRGTKTLPRR